MSLCELKTQALQQIGGISREESLAIVPDIQNYSLELGLQRGYKRCSSVEEELELLSQEQQQLDSSFSVIYPKRHCSSLSPSPDQFQISGKDIYTLEVKPNYHFGGTDSDIFTCGGNSPISSSSSCSADFTPTNTQTSAECQALFNLQGFVPVNSVLPNMQRTVLSHPVVQHTEKYELVITEQPEEYYRARYNSEGVRAPLKGVTENYPTVQVYGPEFRYGMIDVKLVHEDGTPHTSCSLDTSEGRKNAVSKKIGPFNRMIAEFEDLRIRRVKKEGRKKSATLEKSTPKDGRSDKVASLLFTATLETEQGDIVQSIQSRVISLTTAPEPAELDWLEPNRGHFAGQEPLVIKGSKMTSPKVTFCIMLPDGRRQELHGSVDKERSHQNVLLVKTPSLAQMSYQFARQTIPAEVVVVTGRNQMSSNALHFDFIPNHICRECMQETGPRPTHITSYSPLPTYQAAPSAAATGGHSPPPTPGLAPQPSPSPSAHTHAQTTPTQIHLPPPQSQQPSYSGGQSIHPTLAVTSDPVSSPSSTGNRIVHDIQHSCSQPQQQDTAAQGPGKSGDDIMGIMHELMGPDCASSHATLTMHDKEIETQYLYSNPQTSYGQQVASPYIPVTSPSAASDQPCYSPVTPIQSPTSSPWNYIEQMLTSLLQSDQINRQDYRFLTNECAKQNPILLQAFNTSQSNEGIFLQLLASYKPDQTAFQTTHQ